MLDFAVFLRERTVTLAAGDEPFTDDDLANMVAAGRERGARGISPAAQRHVLILHTKLTLREVHEAASPRDLHTVMHALSWLPPAGLSAQDAYTRGYLLGQEALMPVVDRVRVLTDLLLADDAMAARLATNLAMTVTGPCVVLVVRMPGSGARNADPIRTEILEDLLAHHWTPVRWEDPEEFVALVGAEGPVPADERAAAVARDFGQRVGVACAVGAALGEAGGLARALAQARRVSRVAPAHPGPGAVRYPADLLPELAAAQVPEADRWLREVARRLAGGPDLVTTLDCFYRTNMSRLLTAAALRIHPRTLDYRLQRVQERTGLHPTSVRGVRILSTTVNRILSGAWT